MSYFSLKTKKSVSSNEENCKNLDFYLRKTYIYFLFFNLPSINEVLYLSKKKK